MSTPLRERPDAPLGTLIFRAGLLPAETIENALEEGVKTGRRLGEILVERGLIKEEDLTRLLAGQKGLPFVSLREQSVDAQAAQLLAEDQARLFTALPIGFEDGVPVVAVADPTNDVLNRNIREALGQEARFVVAARSELNDAIGELFSGAPSPSLAIDLSVPAPEPNAEPFMEPEPSAEPRPAPETDSAPVEVGIVPPETNAAPEPVGIEPSAPEPEPVAEPVGAGLAPPETDAASEPVAKEPSSAEPEATVELRPEPEVEAEPAFDVSVYEPEPVPAPEPKPSAAEPPPSEPAPDPAPPGVERPAVPETPLAPLTTEPVAAQNIPQSNGEVPKDFEDAPPPPAAADAGYRVSIRFTSGERMTVAECADAGEAKGYAKALTKQLGATDSDDWPFVNGRFLRPDTIVSVDVETL